MNHFENMNKRYVYEDIDYESDESSSSSLDDANACASTLNVKDSVITIIDDDSSDEKSPKMREHDDVLPGHLTQLDINDYQGFQSALSPALRLKNIVENFQDMTKALIKDVNNYVDEYTKDANCSRSHLYLSDFFSLMVTIQTSILNLDNCFRIGLKALGGERNIDLEKSRHLNCSEIGEGCEKRLGCSEIGWNLSARQIKDESGGMDILKEDQSDENGSIASGYESSRLPILMVEVKMEEDQSDQNESIVLSPDLSNPPVLDDVSKIEKHQSNQTQLMICSCESDVHTLLDREIKMENNGKSDISNVESSKSRLYNGETRRITKKDFVIDTKHIYRNVSNVLSVIRNAPVNQEEANIELNKSMNETENDQFVNTEERKAEKSFLQSSSNRDDSCVSFGNGEPNCTEGKPRSRKKKRSKKKEKQEVTKNLLDSYSSSHSTDRDLVEDDGNSFTESASVRSEKYSLCSTGQERLEGNEGDRREPERKKRRSLSFQTSEKNSFDLYPVSGQSENLNPSFENCDKEHCDENRKDELMNEVRTITNTLSPLSPSLGAGQKSKILKHVYSKHKKVYILEPKTSTDTVKGVHQLTNRAATGEELTSNANSVKPAESKYEENYGKLNVDTDHRRLVPINQNQDQNVEQTLSDKAEDTHEKPSVASPKKIVCSNSTEQPVGKVFTCRYYSIHQLKGFNSETDKITCGLDGCGHTGMSLYAFQRHYYGTNFRQGSKKYEYKGCKLKSEEERKLANEKRLCRRSRSSKTKELTATVMEFDNER